MNVREAHRTRHLVIRLDLGDEIPSSLVRALDGAEARSGFITGVGTLESAEVGRPARRVDAVCEVVSLTGNVALLDGTTSVRLSAVLAREAELGLETFGGPLVRARVQALELHVTVFDDLSLTRVADQRTGLPVLDARPAAASALSVTSKPPPAPVEPSPPPPVAAIPLPAAPPPAAPSAPEAPALPQRPQKQAEEIEHYPEAGDTVLHFAFGECTVVGADGDRIRLRQNREGRVLDVALTMLRIEPVGVNPDGTRRFMLHRKN